MGAASVRLASEDPYAREVRLSAQSLSNRWLTLPTPSLVELVLA